MSFRLNSAHQKEKTAAIDGKKFLGIAHSKGQFDNAHVVKHNYKKETKNANKMQFF